VYDENNSVCEVAETEAEALAIAEEALAGLEKFAQQRGEWPEFDQIYVAKVTRVLREDQVNDDNLQVRLVTIS
jgi:predicted RNase H-like HicB family nuclease